MQEQIGGRHFLERRPEGGDELMRQPIDEPDRVGQQHLPRIGQLHAAHQRIERHEQRVRHHGAGARSAG